MEVETAQPPSASGSSSATYPRWVTLERYCKSNVDDSRPTAVAKSLAAARTSNGHPIQVSLSLAEPPATSVVLIKFPDGGVHLDYSVIMASHSDFLLVAVKFKQEYQRTLVDYFVYSAGDAAADPPRPPSLLLLLSRYYPSESTVNRQLLVPHCTGILHPGRGEDEVVVAELMMVAVSKGKDTEKTRVAELFMFRSSAWSVKRARICCGNDDEHEELPSEWKISSVFPVGDRILCWVNNISNNGSVLICDVLEESPYLQHVPLPSVPTRCFGRNVCATADGRTLKFVSIFPRCCCGGAGVSDCQRSHHAYTIHTWTLRMDDGMCMEWVKEAMVDATELWSLDTYKGLPRVPLGFPVVSMYEPHVICFSLCESYHVKRHPDWLPGRVLVSSNVSYYLNSYPPCSSDGMSMEQSLTSKMDKEEKRRDDDGTNSMLRSPCMSTRTEPAAQASEILAAFQEIPSYGLARDDVLKAYAILSSDNGCRVRSLLRLPMKRRKDWLLMEIKGDDA